MAAARQGRGRRRRPRWGHPGLGGISRHCRTPAGGLAGGYSSHVSDVPVPI